MPPFISTPRSIVIFMIAAVFVFWRAWQALTLVVLLFDFGSSSQCQLHRVIPGEVRTLGILLTLEILYREGEFACYNPACLM